jgi:hypothetical protein
MKPVLAILLLASAVGAAHLWIIALNYELPIWLSIIGVAGMLACALLAAATGLDEEGRG